MRCSKGSTKSFCQKFRGGIGYGHAKFIAFNINQTPYMEKRVIRNLVYGKKERPLGRYLTNVIAEEIGIPEDEFERETNHYYDNILESVYGQIAQDNTRPEEERAQTYYDAIRARWKQPRLAQKKRKSIYHKRNKI